MSSSSRVTYFLSVKILVGNRCHTQIKRFEDGSFTRQPVEGKVEGGYNAGPGPAEGPKDLNLLEGRDKTTTAGA